MLHIMRRHAKIFYVFFFLIIITFVFWGTGTNDSVKQARTLATVGEETITTDEFWRGYDRAKTLYTDVYKEKFDDKMSEQLKKDVLSALLQNKILSIAARDSGITVSDEELNDAITSDPVFLRDGVFTTEVYLNTLRLNRMTPAFYEAAQREEMLVKKMFHVIESAVALNSSDTLMMQGDEKLREQIEKALLDEKRTAALSSFVNAYRASLNITVNEDLLL